MNKTISKKGCGRREGRPALFSFLLLGKVCRAFLKDEDGQGVIEYILLLSGTVVGAGLLARGILKALDGGILKLGGQLEKDLKTGRAPISVYQN